MLGNYARRRLAAHFTVITKPLRSALTMAPTELPVSVSTAPFWLVSTIACTPRPTAAPTLPAAQTPEMSDGPHSTAEARLGGAEGAAGEGLRFLCRHARA